MLRREPDLGFLVEQITGQRLDEFFADRIFRPLGMPDAGLHIVPEQADRLSELYGETEGGGIEAIPGLPLRGRAVAPEMPAVELKTYIVEDNATIRENLIGTLQRVDERSEAEEEAETLALLADPTHMQMSELELVRALQSDRDGGQEERY